MGRSERAALRAAIESSKARYLHLECGCKTDFETYEIYRAFQPKRGLAWCENHNKWQKIIWSKGTVEYPQEPLF